MTTDTRRRQFQRSLYATDLESIDTGRVIWIAHSLSDLGVDLAQAWITWFTRHGITDLEQIPIEQLIVCDDGRRRIGFDAYVLDGVDPVIDSGEPRRRRCHVQLEAPALPTPAGGYSVHQVDTTATASPGVSR